MTTNQQPRRRSAMKLVAALITLAGIVGGPVGSANAVVIGAATADELAQAFTDAGDNDIIELAADIAVTDGTLAVPAATAVTLDLKGRELAVTGAAGHPGIAVAENATLTIIDTGGDGVLRARGGNESAGVGTGRQATPGTVIIEGGTVNATGGFTGAGIGGGRVTAGGTVIIEGGSVTATGGYLAAGIGGGQFGAAGTITINGGAVVANGDPEQNGAGAGIGGGHHGHSGIITINDGTVVATGTGIAAGIGGGGYSSGHAGGDITINGGTVTATGGNEGAAGIGSPDGRGHGPVTITGGIVHATGGSNLWRAGPGIGQASDGPMVVTISGGVVTANGTTSGEGKGAAGIGGGIDSRGVPTAISGGTVIANAGQGAAAIGAGWSEEWSGHGADVTIGASADVTVTATTGNAIGNTLDTASFGSLSNAGHLTIATGSTLTIPAGVAVDNSGTLVADGDIVNHGTIINTGTVTNPDNVSVHHYLLDFDLGAASGTPPPAQRVFAATLADALQSVPTDPTFTNHTFDGWRATPSGDRLTDATNLGAGADGPLTQTWSASWLALPVWGAVPTIDLTVDEPAHVTIPLTSADSATITGGVLPTGLQLELTDDGLVIAGTPATGTAGTHTVEITAHGAGGNVAVPVTLTIHAAAAPETTTTTAAPTTTTTTTTVAAASTTTLPAPQPGVPSPTLPATGAGQATVWWAGTFFAGGLTVAVLARRPARHQRP